MKIFLCFVMKDLYILIIMNEYKIKMSEKYIITFLILRKLRKASHDIGKIHDNMQNIEWYMSNDLHRRNLYSYVIVSFLVIDFVRCVQYVDYDKRLIVDMT